MIISHSFNIQVSILLSWHVSKKAGTLLVSLSDRGTHSCEEFTRVECNRYSLTLSPLTLSHLSRATHGTNPNRVAAAASPSSSRPRRRLSVAQPKRVDARMMASRRSTLAAGSPVDLQGASSLPVDSGDGSTLWPFVCGCSRADLAASRPRCVVGRATVTVAVGDRGVLFGRGSGPPCTAALATVLVRAVA